MPTKRLAAFLAGIVAVIVAGTAIAVAAAGSGTPPPPKGLAEAVHDGLTAPPVEGVQGDITFTNRMLDGVDLRGANPVLAGGSGRFWATKDGHVRVELQSSGASSPDAQFESDGKTWWAYDGSSGTVYRGTVPQHHAGNASNSGADQPPPVSKIQQAIDHLMQHADVSGANPGVVGGQGAYSVRVSPKQDGGLLGAAELSWDAAHGVPLQLAVFAKDPSTGKTDSRPVLALTASNLQFGALDPSSFEIPAPAATKSQDVSPPGSGGAGANKHSGRGKPVTGLAAVQAAVPFKLAAPETLAGRARNEVALMGKGAKGAVVTYGQGLGGVAVLEHQVTSRGGAQSGAGGNGNGPLGRSQLPTVTIGGTKAEELSTPLGTVIRFERDGVAYTVIGSVDRAAAEAAVRGL